jgi:Uma2 family endonuclease
VGIPEYWLVNLKRRELIVFRDPDEGEYASKITLTQGEIIPLAFVDIQIAVEAIISA